MKHEFECPITMFIELTKKHEKQFNYGCIELPKVVSYEVSDGVVKFLSEYGKSTIFNMDLVELFGTSGIK